PEGSLINPGKCPLAWGCIRFPTLLERRHRGAGDRSLRTGNDCDQRPTGNWLPRARGFDRKTYRTQRRGSPRSWRLRSFHLGLLLRLFLGDLLPLSLQPFDALAL